MLKVPTLDKWAIFHDVLVGEALDHPSFEQRQRIETNKLIKMDKKENIAFCVSGEIWQLGQEGNLGLYVDPLTKKFY